MTDITKQIVDYAQNDDAVQFRQALYSSIHDRVTAHLDAAKQAVAQNYFNNNEEEVEEPTETNIEPDLATAQDTPVENT
jgi:hypothetical protein